MPDVGSKKYTQISAPVVQGLEPPARPVDRQKTGELRRKIVFNYLYNNEFVN